MATSNSKYGLLIPKKANKGAVLKPASANVFGDDSDEESGSSAVSQSVNRESTKDKVKKQTQLEIDKALQEDPSVYEYDAIYDNIQAQKVTTDVKEAQKVDKKPKYIVGLLKMAELRKREEERRIERKVQKEREEEGEEFADKEAFVTSAYKKKMLEQQEEAERERREAAMEEMLDVTKQKDLSGFYRYLYRETTGSVTADSKEADKTEEKLTVKEEPHSDSENGNASSIRERKPVKVKEETSHTSHRQRSRRGDDDDKIRRSESGSPSEKSRSEASSRRKSREKDRRRHRDRQSHSGSPTHRRSNKNRHRSRSRDRKRTRSSSRDRGKRRSRSGDRKPRDDKNRSGKESERRSHSCGEERSPSTGTKDVSAKVSSSSPERHSSPEMLPARPPSEDLDRDDPASESDSLVDETQDEKRKHQGWEEDRNQAAEMNERKKQEPAESSGDKKQEPLAKYGRKTTETEVLDARQRFLARKLARERARPVVEPE